MSRKKTYWTCQVAGWLIFVLLNSLFIQLRSGLNTETSVSLFSTFILGIFLSHGFRSIIVKQDWLRNNPFRLIPRFLISAVVISAIHHVFQASIDIFIFKNLKDWTNIIDVLAGILNVAFIYILWSLIYFLVHFIENYKKEEIKNLRWEASKNEFELNRLKSQLNPHFMFNSMNSIRALVDENPVKAKDAITQLSNILRNTLQMGKKKLIPFEEELNIVKDYLSLESTRYEERLKVEYKIAPESFLFQTPPLMLQTIVENGIKHGISKLVKGGLIIIETQKNNDKLYINIINSGQLKDLEKSESGFGIKNTVERLKLLYGEAASFKLENLNSNEVITQIIIPQTYESTDN